jgi:NAD(P)-dependent dehydrogenase (short-subunit alcohol dehydrogenase family)
LQYLHKEEGIRINTICPSFVETPLVLNAIKFFTNKEVPPGTLVELGVALSVETVASMFLDVLNDEK